MIALAGHGKNERLIQTELPIVPNVGDRIEINSKHDDFKGEGFFVKLSPMTSWWGVEIKDKKTKLVKYFDPSDCKIAELPKFQIGDRVKDNDGFIGVITDLKPNHLTVENPTDRKCYNLTLHKKPLHKLISHISTSLEELELSPKLAVAQKKSRRSHIATSTHKPKQSTETTSQNQQSMATSEIVTPVEALIYIQEDSPVLEPQSLENVTDFTTQNLISGTNTSESLTKENLTLSSSKILQDCLMENSISEWVKSCKTFPKSGIWENGKFSQQDTLDRPKLEKGCLSLPTLTTGIGSKRNAGATSCETWLKDKGFVQPTQALSIEMMCLLFGFPIAWAKSLSNAPKDRLGEQQPESSLVEQSISTVRSSQLNESSICTEFSANSIDARLQVLLEQRDRLIASGASPQGVWLSVGQVYKKDFRQVVWKSAKEHEWLGGNKSRYIGKENSDEHKSAIAQHKAGQELRKIEREIKSIQKKLEKS